LRSSVEKGGECPREMTTEKDAQIEEKHNDLPAGDYSSIYCMRQVKRKNSVG